MNIEKSNTFYGEVYSLLWVSIVNINFLTVYYTLIKLSELYLRTSLAYRFAAMSSKDKGITIPQFRTNGVSW